MRELTMAHSRSNQIQKKPTDMFHLRIAFFLAATILSLEWNAAQGTGEFLQPIKDRRFDRRSFLRSRHLGEVSEFDTQLYLDLQFVGETTATELETRDCENAAVIHFCDAVQQQVRITRRV
jgi:hypothetical protein